jgi:hypothetical protein
MDQGTNTRAGALPGALWAVIAMFAITAACLLGPTLALLRLGFAFFAISPALGSLGVAVALVMAAVVVGFARIGYGLYEGSRVARGLAFVAAGYLLLAALATDLRSAMTVLIALGCVATAAMLALVPAVRAWFAGPWSRDTALPTSIVVGQNVVLICSAITALLAATMLVAGLALVAEPGLGGTASGMIVGALLSAGTAAAGFWAKAAVGRGERSARIVISSVAVADLIVVVILSTSDQSTLPLLASFVLHVGVLAAIWAPTDARRHFGEPPIPAVENLHRQILSIGTTTPPFRPAGPVPPPTMASRPGPTLPPGPVPPARGPRPGPFPPTGSHARHVAPPPQGWSPGPPVPPPTPPSPATGVPGAAGRHSRPNLDIATTEPAPTFCGQCGSRTLPKTVHCVRCGSRLAGLGTPEPQP